MKVEDRLLIWNSKVKEKRDLTKYELEKLKQSECVFHPKLLTTAKKSNTPRLTKREKS